MAIEVLRRPAGNSGVDRRWVCHLALSVVAARRKKGQLEGLGLVFETETLVDNDELKTAFFTDPGGNRSQIVWRKKRLIKALMPTSWLASLETASVVVGVSPRLISVLIKSKGSGTHGHNCRHSSPNETADHGRTMTLDEFREAEELRSIPL